MGLLDFGLEGIRTERSGKLKFICKSKCVFNVRVFKENICFPVKEVGTIVVCDLTQNGLFFPILMAPRVNGLLARAVSHFVAKNVFFFRYFLGENITYILVISGISYA